MRSFMRDGVPEPPQIAPATASGMWRAGMVEHSVRSHGVTNLRIDGNVAQLLAARRYLWDVRGSSTTVAMLELLRKSALGSSLGAARRTRLTDS